jgi:O-antigen/teichoic acid export membrane protein
MDRRLANWDLQNIFKNYFSLVTTQFGSAFFSFASVYIATRYLGTEGYGGIVALLAASQTVQIMVGWTGVALARYGVEEFIETGEISKSFWGRALVVLSNLLPLVLVAPWLLTFLIAWLKLPPETAPLIVFHFIFMAFWFHVQWTLQAAKLLRLQGILLLVERAFIFVTLLILALSNQISWQIAFAAYIIAPLITAIIGLWQTRALISLKPVIDKKRIKKLLAFSVPLIPFSVVSFFSTNYLDAFFISKYLPKSELGVYAVAYQINGIVFQFPTLLNTLLMPMFVTMQNSGQHEQVKKFIEEILPVLTLLWGFLTVVVAVSASLLLPFIFDNDFKQIETVLWILIAGAALTFPTVVAYSSFATANEAVHINTPFAIAVAIGNLGGNILLIPTWGIVGSAWATVISSALGLFVFVGLMYYRFSLSPKWTIQAIFPTVFCSACFSWTGSVLQSFIVAVLTSLFLIVVYRKSVVKAVNSLWRLKGQLQAGQP